MESREAGGGALEKRNGVTKRYGRGDVLEASHSSKSKSSLCKKRFAHGRPSKRKSTMSLYLVASPSRPHTVFFFFFISELQHQIDIDLSMN